MKRRETISLVSGILIGLLVGLLLLGISDDLREELYGTVVNDRTKQDIASADAKAQANYYLVELSDAQAWLGEQKPELQEDEELDSAVSKIDSLTKSANFRTDVKNAEEAIDLLLPQVVATMLDREVEALETDQVNPVMACLGTNRDDPYAENEPDMYIYLTIPADQDLAVEIPDTWEKLDKPKTNDLYWQWLGCFPSPTSTK